MTEFAEFLDQNGMKLNEFCARYNVKYRTAQDWKNGKSKMPEYLLPLLRENIEVIRQNAALMYLMASKEIDAGEIKTLLDK